MTQRQIAIIAISFSLLATGFLTMKFLSSQKKIPQKKQAPPASRYVKTMVVNYETIQATVKAPGRLSSGEKVMVVAEASGKIELGAIPLKKGQSFKKGDILLNIYKAEAELELKAQKSKFLNSIAGILPDLKVDFPETYQNFSSFFQSLDIQKDLLPMPSVSDGNTKVFLASRNILADYYSIKKNELKLKRHTIFAPFNGTFIEVLMERGSYVNTGGRIGEIINTDVLELEVPVENRYSEWIKINDPVEVYANDRNKQWKGYVLRKSDYVEESTQSRTIYVQIKPEKYFKLFAGEYLTAEFQGGRIEKAMVIPRNAVFNHNEVFVVIDGKLQKREIEILKMDESTLIFSGIEEGINLVVEPLINARENSLVKVLPQDL